MTFFWWTVDVAWGLVISHGGAGLEREVSQDLAAKRQTCPLRSTKNNLTLLALP